MRLSVKVKAQSKSEKVERITKSQYEVWVKAPAKEGKANLAVIALLSRYFDLPKSAIDILRGHSSRNKLLEIDCIKLKEGL
jgi:uncharacterized protein